MKTIAIFLLVLFAQSCSMTSVRGGESASVTYIPLHVATYLPVSRTNIDQAKGCQFDSVHLRREDFETTDQLGGGVVFDEANVRIKIAFHDKTYFVDDRGLVYPGNRDLKINKATFDSFIAKLEELRKGGSCNQFDWLDR